MVQSPWVQAVLTVGLSIALIRPFGIKGVAWATAVPLAVQSVVVIAIACRAAHVRFSSYLYHAWTTPLLAACFLATVWSLSGVWFPPISSWAALFAIGLGGVAIYVPLVLCVDPSLRRLARQVLARLKSSAHTHVAVGDLAPIGKED